MSVVTDPRDLDDRGGAPPPPATTSSTCDSAASASTSRTAASASSHRSQPTTSETVDDPVLLRRRFAGPTVASDGELIRGKVVPYGEVAIVTDGGGDPYREMFVRGAFRNATIDPSRVLLDFEHRTGITDVIGHAVDLVERDDGLHGTFRLLPTPAGDQAEALHRAGVLTNFSVGAVVLSPRRTVNGVVVRDRCHLDRVALCRRPAYAGTEAHSHQPAAA